MIDKLYMEFVQKAIPPNTPVTFNDVCVGHTVGDNFTCKPVKIMLYPHAYYTMRLCDSGRIDSLEIRKCDADE